MRVKKKRKFQRGGGVFTNPSGTEIPSGWGVKTKKPSVGGGGGMDIFWNCTLLVQNIVQKKVGSLFWAGCTKLTQSEIKTIINNI